MFFHLKAINVPVSFEYLYYGSTAIINILLFQCEDLNIESNPDV